MLCFFLPSLRLFLKHLVGCSFLLVLFPPFRKPSVVPFTHAKATHTTIITNQLVHFFVDAFAFDLDGGGGVDFFFFLAGLPLPFDVFSSSSLSLPLSLPLVSASLSLSSLDAPIG